MDKEEMIKRVAICSGHKDDEAIIDEPYKVPYFVHSVEDNHAIKQMLDLYTKQSILVEKLKEELERHITFCEQEASGSLNNEICHIALKFDKSLLELITGEE